MSDFNVNWTGYTTSKAVQFIGDKDKYNLV